MSLRAAFEEQQTDMQRPKGVVADWYYNLPEHEQDFVLHQIRAGQTGWKRALWKAACKTGLRASETRFREFLAQLEANQ